MTDVAIALEGVMKRFGPVVALDGIDLEVPPGAVLGLLGPNGAGKTTAVRVLTTLIPPDAGRARVLDRDVVREAASVRQLIGLAGQYAAVDEILTGRENLRLVGRLTQLPRRLAAARADELLERFGLAAAADRPVRTYSGGMRRRLDLAAALVHRPPVLFLDEPTTGLDPQSRMELWEVIRELVADGTTLLLTTQYLEEADRLAHRIAVVDRGQVIAEGTPSELKARTGNIVVEVGLVDANAAARAAMLLSRRFVTERPEQDGSAVRLSTHDGAVMLLDVLRTLDAEGLVPTTVNVREPSLDDAFLAVTGRHAESPDTGSQLPTRGAA
ncbi:MAG TPA: ATP-binding cassette domain-containing protein [Acidimicrobiales bacterium]|nr:ATP-binding cassette domain-containing protein [Acidimicrobiales bacterium]